MNILHPRKQLISSLIRRAANPALQGENGVIRNGGGLRSDLLALGELDGRCHKLHPDENFIVDRGQCQGRR